MCVRVRVRDLLDRPLGELGEGVASVCSAPGAVLSLSPVFLFSLFHGFPIFPHTHHCLLVFNYHFHSFSFLFFFFSIYRFILSHWHSYSSNCLSSQFLFILSSTFVVQG
ncbi:hypothetical protein GQ42DRAFT_17541 [Ramicandelaber brevisporus]|nr:hypothetical protein GQ42DRAFT_17541 [Ramicandelaber brevisporus]